MLFTKLFARAVALAAIASSPALAGPIGSTTGAYESAGVAAIGGAAEPNYRAAFQAWKRMDGGAQQFVSIPSTKPVSMIAPSSSFGLRVHPIDGVVKMHAGIDLPGPLGTPVYATADAMVGRAGWSGGYGNLIELNHGGSVTTRYGHLSAIVVQPGQRVVRGQLIGRMGSTGHSTGSHLHYEVRLEGKPVNPLPFLQSANFSTAIANAQPIEASQVDLVDGD